MLEELKSVTIIIEDSGGVSQSCQLLSAAFHVLPKEPLLQVAIPVQIPHVLLHHVLQDHVPPERSSQFLLAVVVDPACPGQLVDLRIRLGT